MIKRTEESEIEANTDPHAEKNKNTNLSFITVNENLEHQDCRHNPIDNIDNRNGPSWQSQLARKYMKYIEQSPYANSTQEHHENRMKLNVKCHLNSLPRNPLDFSWVFPST